MFSFLILVGVSFRILWRGTEFNTRSYLRSSPPPLTHIASSHSRNKHLCAPLTMIYNKGTMLFGSERSRSQQCCREACHSHNDNVARLGEIALAMMISQGLLLSRRRCREDRRDHACDDDVARIITLATTMLRGLERLLSRRQC